VSNFSTLFKISLILALLSSCGVKKNSEADLNNTNAYIKTMLSSKSCSTDSNSELETKIQSLEKKLKLIVVEKSERRFHKLKNKARPSQIEQVAFSKNIFEKRVSSLEEEINTSIENSTSTIKIREIRRKLQKLKIDLNRWSFHQCHLSNLIDNDNQEINDFIELESSMCGDKCENSIMSGVLISDSERREKTISVCSLFNRVSYCRVQYDVATIYNDENKFTQEIIKKARQYFNREVFGMIDSPLDIECVNGEKKEITIPIYQNENSASLMNAISENWKSNDIEIKYKLGNSGARLELVDEGLSRVQLDNMSTIYLNKNIMGVQRVKTIAHEFGHSLGFRDCYIEYFDLKRDEIVYYELERDKGNLMCSLEYGTNIPKKYLEKVVSKYCK